MCFTICENKLALTPNPPHFPFLPNTFVCWVKEKVECRSIFYCVVARGQRTTTYSRADKYGWLAANSGQLLVIRGCCVDNNDLDLYSSYVIIKPHRVLHKITQYRLWSFYFVWTLQEAASPCWGETRICLSKCANVGTATAQCQVSFCYVVCPVQPSNWDQDCKYCQL